jgi:membrane fusion protein, multidrug efflux system
MRKTLLVVLVLIAVVGFAGYLRFTGGASSPESNTSASRSEGGGGPGMRGMGGMIGAARPPMTVELAPVRRDAVSERLTVVGNLIGAATVEVAPKISGRLHSVAVRLGDPVRTGQTIAQLEDLEIREQVKQARASLEVSEASVRQREADLRFAETNLARSRNLFDRQLLARQALDDAEARFEAARAQLDLTRAQLTQARARLEELQINLANTTIVSPVDGFVGRRNLDQGAFASANTPVVSVVDIRLVRVVANLVERDLRRVSAGTLAEVEVDAYQGEIFQGVVARIAPILDPSTRTAQIEVEIPNRDFRLKPGMYARARFVVGQRADALVVNRNSLVDIDGRKGVFVASENTAQFRPVEVGIQDKDAVEVLNGVLEGEPVITTGAAGLRDGDRILLPTRPSGAGAGERAGPPDGVRRRMSERTSSTR